ncbi:MAG: DUF1501 domain-containing protein [Proteobacteria bacterium]|nr:DUF1501 domain-containing protein [Pseudomonadota bacterium]
MTRPVNRRELLLGAAGGLSSVVLLDSLFKGEWPVFQASADLVEKNRNVLVVVFLRGGFDGLSFVCPTQGQDRVFYDAARPTLALPLSGPHASLKLDERFGMNAAAKPLFDLYGQKRLALWQSCGLPVPSRSHFAAQVLMELGASRSGADSRGWLTRFLQQHPLKAAVIGPLRPTSLKGAADIMAYNRLRGLGLTGAAEPQSQLRNALRRLYGQQGADGTYGLSALNMLDELEELSLKGKPAENQEQSTGGEIGQKFSIAAQLLQKDPKLQVLTLDIGGWDTHRQQGNTGDGYFAKQLGQLSAAAADFQQQCLASGNAWVTTVFMSEFGRRLKENGNRGTDHGHGNVVAVVGPKVRGGQVLGQWSGLSNEQLFERSDLAVTTDVRLILIECLRSVVPDVSLKTVFPEIVPSGASVPALFH